VSLILFQFLFGFLFLFRDPFLSLLLMNVIAILLINLCSLFPPEMIPSSPRLDSARAARNAGGGRSRTMLLTARQEALSRNLRHHWRDTVAGVPWQKKGPSPSGAPPVLAGALAWIDCALEQGGGGELTAPRPVRSLDVSADRP